MNRNRVLNKGNTGTLQTEHLSIKVTTHLRSSQTKKMKAAAICAIVLLTIYQAAALKCNYCFSKESDLCTPTSTQTCSGRANACGAVIMQGALHSSFRQCMNMAVCQGYIQTPGVFATCCSTDLCN